MDWENNPEDLRKAMDMVPMMDAFIKQIKAVIRKKLEEDPNCIPQYKLSKGRTITSYEAKEVAKILLDTNQISWDDFLEACSYKHTTMKKVWASKKAIKQSEAKEYLDKKLSGIAKKTNAQPSINKIK